MRSFNHRPIRPTFKNTRHGAPFDEDHYIFGEFDAAEAFAHITTSLCFFGHTHFPFVYSEKDNLVNGTFLAGHHSIVITQRYTHSSDERKRKAVEILSKKSDKNGSLFLGKNRDKTGQDSDNLVTIENQSRLIS